MAGLDPTVAVAITGAVGIVSPLILSAGAARRQKRELRAEIGRERRHALREVLDDGAKLLRRVIAQPWLLSGPRIEVWQDDEWSAQAQVSADEARAVYGRLSLWFPNDHPILDSWRRATEALRALGRWHAELASDEPPPPEAKEKEWFDRLNATYELEKAKFERAETEYFAACRKLLTGSDPLP